MAPQPQQLGYKVDLILHLQRPSALHTEGTVGVKENKWKVDATDNKHPRNEVAPLGKEAVALRHCCF